MPQAKIRTTFTSSSLENVSTSPGPTARAGLLAATEFTRTLPALTIPVAIERDLKNRACHSHLSSRMVSRGVSVNPF
jgi:hypothetical protein